MIKKQYLLKISGKNPKQFLRLLYKLHINLEKVVYQEQAILVWVDKNSYQQIKKIKTSYEIKVISRKGIARIEYFFQHYLLFLIILICGCFLLFFLTHLIFEVEVIHTDSKVRQLIEDELKNEGIAKYNFQVSYDRQEEIVADILKKHKDTIEWLEIERVGTKYIVKVEQRKINKTKVENKPQDIVAKKDGIILKIEATNGTIIKKKNDYVKKGDIIVTGVIKNQDTLMKLVPAEAVVYAETWYKSTVEMPLHYEESFLTGNKKKIIRIKFLNHEIGLFDFHPFTNSKDQVTSIISNPLLPISLEYVKEEELRIINENYTREEATKKAEELARKKLTNKLGVNDSIISQKTLKITTKDSKIVVEVFFKVKEDITDTVLIDEKKLLEESKTEE